jgi:hypothetical protein
MLLDINREDCHQLVVSDEAFDLSTNKMYDTSTSRRNSTVIGGTRNGREDA